MNSQTTLIQGLPRFDSAYIETNYNTLTSGRVSFQDDYLLFDGGNTTFSFSREAVTRRTPDTRHAFWSGFWHGTKPSDAVFGFVVDGVKYRMEFESVYGDPMFSAGCISWYRSGRDAAGCSVYPPLTANLAALQEAKRERFAATCAVGAASLLLVAAAVLWFFNLHGTQLLSSIQVLYMALLGLVLGAKPQTHVFAVQKSISALEAELARQASS